MMGLGFSLLSPFEESSVGCLMDGSQKRFTVDSEHRAVSHSSASCVPGGVLEQSNLAEVVARIEVGDVTLARTGFVGRDLDAAVNDDVERIGFFSLRNEIFTGGN